MMLGLAALLGGSCGDANIPQRPLQRIGKEAQKGCFYYADRNNNGRYDQQRDLMTNNICCSHRYIPNTHQDYLTVYFPCSQHPCTLSPEEVTELRSSIFSFSLAQH